MTKRKHNGHQWRTLQRRIRARDTHCHICGQPIDKTLPALHPWSFEIDHITPISRGGQEYDPHNLAGAHRLCNQHKSNRAPKPQAGPCTNSRDWTQPTNQ